MLFPPRAVERAMKVKEVVMRALNKEYSWLQAAEILGISPRGLRRLRERMETVGYEGLIDMRCGRPSPRRTPVAEVERILELYRDRYSGYNARHFYQTVRREHGVTLSYTHVKQLLQGAGLRKKGRARGRHRLRRERKARFGQMLHLDGSSHHWLSLLPEDKQTLIQVVDDATSRLLYAQLWDGETCMAVMTTLRDVVASYGIPESLYTDRAGWAFETPKAGGRVNKLHLTQVGAALARLGIEHIPSYSPQARGRSERMNRTLQDRLVNELRAAGIDRVDAANRYLLERYIPTHNEAFEKPPREPFSAFVGLGQVDLDDIFFEESVRTVGKDNTLSLEGLCFQIYPQPARRTCAGLSLQVRRHLDGTYSLRRGTQIFGRYDQTARPVETAGPVENRQRPRFPTRTLDAGKRSRRPHFPQAPAAGS
jgi:transposase